MDLLIGILGRKYIYHPPIVDGRPVIQTNTTPIKPPQSQSQLDYTIRQHHISSRRGSSKSSKSSKAPKRRVYPCTPTDHQHSRAPSADRSTLKRRLLFQRSLAHLAASGYSTSPLLTRLWPGRACFHHQPFACLALLL